MCGEAVAIEQFADQGCDCVVGEAQCVSFAFEWGWCEEPTVEEWDVTKGACGGCALVQWCVQRAEEEWTEEAMVE